MSSLDTRISIILAPKKIQKGAILVSAYSDCPGKWLLNKRRVIVVHIIVKYLLY